MSIQKKSLLSSLNTTKKAIVASSQAKPSVSAPISARAQARLAPIVRGRVAGRVWGRTKV